MCLHVSTCVYMCLNISLVLAIMFTFTPIHVLLEFRTCIELSTQYGFSPLCVANLPFVCPFADTVFCILCYVFID